MRSDVVIGSVFPDYELPDHTGKHRKLSEIQGGDPLIVVLSRGSFCPKDQQQMRRLTDLEKELEVGYARIVTISTAPAAARPGCAATRRSRTRAVWHSAIGLPRVPMRSGRDDMPAVLACFARAFQHSRLS